MTADATVVDPHLITAINQLRPPCEARSDTGDCGDPAAWAITWTVRGDGHQHGPVLACVAHKGALDRHRQHCVPCWLLWDVTAVEI